jgi:UDP-N-acetylglucosamine diphosphorylase/glucosamine-1-phosphate N-acetyltransferase
MKAVILAAGKSTRTYPLTLTRPKPLLPVMNRPILAHQLDALEGLVDEVVLVVGYKQEMIRERFGDNYAGLSLTYVEQTEQRGTGHAIEQCAAILTDSFLALNGDDLFDRNDIARLGDREQAVLVKEVDDPQQYGIFELDDTGNVVRLTEKPAKPASNLANLGVYKFTSDIFQVLAETEASERGEIEITSAIQTLADRGQFSAVAAEGYWLPVGYPWHLLDANAYLFDHQFTAKVDGDVHAGAHVSGAVSIGKGTTVKPGSVIEGPVYIGENCDIGPNCWIRPYSVIGDGCKVGQGSEIKGSILMNGAKAPHQNYVGDSVVGEGANLGCGTVTANFRHDGGNHCSMVNGKLVDTGRRKLGAIIGDDVHTGIHTSIYPGRKLWPGMSTLPGTVVSGDLA